MLLIYSRIPAQPLDARNQHTGATQGASGSGTDNLGGVGGPRRCPPPPPALLAAPPGALRARAGAPAAPRTRHSPGKGFSPPLPGAPRAPLSEATGAPCGEGALTSTAGAPRRQQPRVPARTAFAALGRDSSGNGEKAEDARVAEPLGTAGLDLARLALTARLSLASACQTWAHVLPRRRWRALPEPRRRGESKHLAGFPSPGRAPPPTEPSGRPLASAASSFRGNQAVVELAAKGEVQGGCPSPPPAWRRRPGRPRARPAGSLHPMPPAHQHSLESRTPPARSCSLTRRSPSLLAPEAVSLLFFPGDAPGSLVFPAPVRGSPGTCRPLQSGREH